MNLNEEIERIQTLIGVKELLNEQPFWVKAAGLIDDIVRGGKNLSPEAAAFKNATNVTDDIIKSARGGSVPARRKLISSLTNSYGNISRAYGDDIAQEYFRIMEALRNNPKKFAKYFDESGRFNPAPGQRDGILLRAIENKSVTQGARTAGKGLTQTINKIKDVKQGSTEFIKTIEQNVINNTNITNIYSNKNYIFIVDDLVSKGIPKAVAQDTAMSIMVNRPIINVNNTVINNITKIDDFVVGNRNNLNIVNIENNTIKNIKASGGGASSSVLRVKDLSDDVLSRYREYERIAKESTKINPKTGRVFGYGKDGKWNPSEAARQRWIKQAMDDAKAAGQGSAQALKGLSWKNWLAIGAAVGLTGTGLWFLLSDDEEITPEDMPLAGDVDNGIIPPVYDDNTGSDEVTNDEYFDGQLGERVLRDEETPRGEDVKDLQRRLNILYGFDLKEDGIYGPNTASKVKEFQRRADISVDGDFGPASLEALLKAESGNVQQDTTQSDSADAPEDNLELMEPIIVKNIENKKKEIADAGLSDVPENELIVVQAPENVSQNVTDKVIVRGAKQCPDGKTPVLVKSKEKEVNRKNKKKRKTIAVYRCRKV